MFTFRRMTVLFFALLLAFNLASIFFCGTAGNFFCVHAAWFYIFLFVLYFGISVAMAFLPCSGYHHPAICSGKTIEKKVALTFDDGPDPAATPVILETLGIHHTPAAFFLIGKNTIGNEALLQRINAEGHLIGIHSWGHSKWFDFFPPRMIRQDLMHCSDAIRNATGRKPVLFRPPFGVVNPMVAGAVRKGHWSVVAWNIRSLDTMGGDPEKICGKILRRLRPGAIILLHDHSAFTATHLPVLLKRIAERGFAVVPLDELIKRDAYEE